MNYTFPLLELLQINITLTEGALLIFLQSGVKNCWCMAGDQTSNFK